MSNDEMLVINIVVGANSSTTLQCSSPENTNDFMKCVKVLVENMKNDEHHLHEILKMHHILDGILERHLKEVGHQC